MSLRSFLPSLLGSGTTPGTDPLASLRQDIDRAFDSFGRLAPLLGSAPAPFGWSDTGPVPRINMTRKEDKLEVAAELPGVDIKDVELVINDDMLTITGEKKNEREDKNAERQLYECSYGAFSRSIRLPFQVNAEDVTAEIRNGVLHVTIPLPPEAASKGQRITIRGAEENTTGKQAEGAGGQPVQPPGTAEKAA
jgi:HSP20 family protein